VTDFQAKMLVKFGKDNICVDGTHGLKLQFSVIGTGYLMVMNMVMGLQWHFVLTLNLILLHIHYFPNPLIHIIKSYVFMSDDEPEFHNAWCSVMDEGSKQLVFILQLYMH